METRVRSSSRPDLRVAVPLLCKLAVMAGLEVNGVQDAEDVFCGVPPGKGRGLSLSVRFSINPGMDPGQLLPRLKSHIRSRLHTLTGTLPSVIDVALTQGCWPGPTEPSGVSSVAGSYVQPLSTQPLSTADHPGNEVLTDTPRVLTRQDVEAVVAEALAGVVGSALADDPDGPRRPLFSRTRIRVDGLEPTLLVHLSLMVPYGLALPEVTLLLSNLIRSRIDAVWPEHPVRLVIEYRDLALENV